MTKRLPLTTIGVDESGTGAWAGPFTVTASALRRFVPEGLRDSKELKDERRNYFSAILLDEADYHTEVVSVSRIARLGQGVAWEEAVIKSTSIVLEKLLTSGENKDNVRLVVDGLGSDRLKRAFLRFGVAQVVFIPKAENRYREVAAASILAKTERNVLMRALHKSYPMYGWDRNYGYGTAEHRDAIERHGRVVHHRNITFRK